MNKKSKINTNKKVMKQNKDFIFPNVGNEIVIRTVSLTPKDFEKLNKLQTKYKLSRSAIVRILLSQVEAV